MTDFLTKCSTLRAALFDLDGVLCDTEPIYTRFWGEMGRTYLPERPNFAEDIKGMTLQSIYQTFLPERPALQQRLTELAIAHEREMEFPLFKGALAVVDRLRELGWRTAIVTSSSQRKMQCLYHHHPAFAAHFDYVQTAEGVKRSKPAPDCYLAAAAALGMRPEECAALEDSHNGLLAARAAGCHVVGLLTSLPRERVEPLCDEVITSLTGLAAGWGL